MFSLSSHLGALGLLGVLGALGLLGALGVLGALWPATVDGEPVVRNVFVPSCLVCTTDAALAQHEPAVVPLYFVDKPALHLIFETKVVFKGYVVVAILG